MMSNRSTVVEFLAGPRPYEATYVPTHLSKAIHQYPHLNVSLQPVNDTFDWNSSDYKKSLWIGGTFYLILFLLILIPILCCFACIGIPQKKVFECRKMRLFVYVLIYTSSCLLITGVILEIVFHESALISLNDIRRNESFLVVQDKGDPKVKTTYHPLTSKIFQDIQDATDTLSQEELKASKSTIMNAIIEYGQLEKSIVDYTSQKPVFTINPFQNVKAREWKYFTYLMIFWLTSIVLITGHIWLIKMLCYFRILAFTTIIYLCAFAALLKARTMGIADACQIPWKIADMIRVDRTYHHAMDENCMNWVRRSNKIFFEIYKLKVKTLRQMTNELRYWGRTFDINEAPSAPDINEICPRYTTATQYQYDTEYTVRRICVSDTILSISFVQWILVIISILLMTILLFCAVCRSCDVMICAIKDNLGRCSGPSSIHFKKSTKCIKIDVPVKTTVATFKRMKSRHEHSQANLCGSNVGSFILVPQYNRIPSNSNFQRCSPAIHIDDSMDNIQQKHVDFCDSGHQPTPIYGQILSNPNYDRLSPEIYIQESSSGSEFSPIMSSVFHHSVTSIYATSTVRASSIFNFPSARLISGLNSSSRMYLLSKFTLEQSLVPTVPSIRPRNFSNSLRLHISKFISRFQSKHDEEANPMELISRYTVSLKSGSRPKRSCFGIKSTHKPKSSLDGIKFLKDKPKVPLPNSSKSTSQFSSDITSGMKSNSSSSVEECALIDKTGKSSAQVIITSHFNAIFKSKLTSSEQLDSTCFSLVPPLQSKHSSTGSRVKFKLTMETPNSVKYEAPSSSTSEHQTISSPGPASTSNEGGIPRKTLLKNKSPTINVFSLKHKKNFRFTTNTKIPALEVQCSSARSKMSHRPRYSVAKSTYRPYHSSTMKPGSSMKAGSRPTSPRIPLHTLVRNVRHYTITKKRARSANVRRLRISKEINESSV